jgi:hypothetical protein
MGETEITITIITTITITITMITITMVTITMVTMLMLVVLPCMLNVVKKTSTVQNVVKVVLAKLLINGILNVFNKFNIF